MATQHEHPIPGSDRHGPWGGPIRLGDALRITAVTLRWRDWTSGATFEPRDRFNVLLNRSIEWSVNRPWRRRRLRKLRRRLKRRVDQILRMSNLAAARKWLPGNPLQVFADSFEDA